MMYKLAIGAVISMATFFWYAHNNTTNVSPESNVIEKHTYWFDGKAELASYKLSQHRYGQLHDGEAVLIFVSEDFSASKQVKLDKPDKAGKDKVSIMKMNLTKSFLTGIYPYTIVNSVFTPFDLSGTIKTSCSVQEWCGHAYTQLNKIPKGYKATQFSYFESEGDQVTELPNTILEDELWTMIRINPAKIPTGKVNLIRGSQAVRLKHQPLESISALITKGSRQLENQPVESISIEFDDRKLNIYYDKMYPHTIRGWDESYDEWGQGIKTTQARLIKTMRLPYWELHDNKHRLYRDSLGLD
jgi:hypothetical protein